MGSAAKNRSAKPTWVDVIKIEIKLDDCANVGAALSIDRDQCFGGDLKSLADPNNPGVNGASRQGAGRGGVSYRCLKRGFDQ